jgi:hypothetical protein
MTNDTNNHDRHEAIKREIAARVAAKSPSMICWRC